MENTTKIKTMSANKIFDNTHMIIKLPITEDAMSVEMLEDYHREVDRWTDSPIFEGCEALLQIDIFEDGDKFFTLLIEKYYKDEPTDTSGLYLDLPSELEDYYYKMAIIAFAENLMKYNK